MNRVLFICPDPRISASTRYRAAQIVDELVKRRWNARLISYESDFGYRLIHSKGRTAAKLFYVLGRTLGYSFQMLKEAMGSDIVVVQRGCMPFGPPVFEWILKRLFHKPLIFDIDDALFVNVVTRENSLFGYFKMNPFRTGWIVRNADAVIAGSPVLKEYALSLNERVFWVPTTTYPHMCKRVQEGKRVVIGWVGSRATSQYLRGLRHVFERILNERENVELRMVGALPTDIIVHPRCQLIPWELEKADEYFCDIDIGINPLVDDRFTRAKCAFKLIQYMAHGIPSVASPVGMNALVIDHGSTGFLANTETEWEQYLLMLIDDAEMRKSMGDRAREKMIRYYSTDIAVEAVQRVLSICLNDKRKCS